VEEDAELHSKGIFSPDDKGLSEKTKQILEQAKTAFAEDRYEEADSLLLQFREASEQERAELSTLSGIKKGAQNFFRRYWYLIILFIFAISVIGMLAYKKINLRLLKNKIKRMRVEKQVLKGLMKKAQTERFKKNKISKLVYEIRMKKYGEKIQKIKEELPVFEERLEKLGKGLKKKENIKQYKDEKQKKK
tara:strand:+ start:21 stop:593 length:573 start_codon:yes stop_codon:yes gene_type:complete